MTMTLIETKTLGTAAAQIEFTSIPQDGTDLCVVLSLRTARTGDVDDPINIELNGTSSGFSGRHLVGSGSGVSSATRTNLVYFGTSSAATSNTFDNAAIYFPNYTASTNKSYSVDGVSENNGTLAYQNLLAGLLSNTSAITSILFRSGTANNLVAGSTISLYKITKGSSGGVTTS